MRSFLRFAVLAGVLAGVAACSGGGDAPPAPTSSAAIELAEVSGRPGDTVQVEGRLRGGSGEIVAASTDIVFDSRVASLILRGDGKPDCVVSTAIGSDSGIGKELIAAQLPSPTEARVVRLGIVALDNTNVIPDGPLFSCKFRIDSSAATGAVELKNQPGASRANATTVPVAGRSGRITVQ